MKYLHEKYANIMNDSNNVIARSYYKDDRAIEYLNRKERIVLVVLYSNDDSIKIFSEEKRKRKVYKSEKRVRKLMSKGKLPDGVGDKIKFDGKIEHRISHGRYFSRSSNWMEYGCYRNDNKNGLWIEQSCEDSSLCNYRYINYKYSWVVNLFHPSRNFVYDYNSNTKKYYYKGMRNGLTLGFKKGVLYYQENYRFGKMIIPRCR